MKNQNCHNSLISPSVFEQVGKKIKNNLFLFFIELTKNYFLVSNRETNCRAKVTRTK